MSEHQPNTEKQFDDYSDSWSVLKNCKIVSEEIAPHGKAILQMKDVLDGMVQLDTNDPKNIPVFFSLFQKLLITARETIDTYNLEDKLAVDNTTFQAPTDLTKIQPAEKPTNTTSLTTSDLTNTLVAKEPQLDSDNIIRHEVTTPLPTQINQRTLPQVEINFQNENPDKTSLLKALKPQLISV